MNIEEASKIEILKNLIQIYAEQENTKVDIKIVNKLWDLEKEKI